MAEKSEKKIEKFNYKTTKYFLNVFVLFKGIIIGFNTLILLYLNISVFVKIKM